MEAYILRIVISRRLNKSAGNIRSNARDVTNIIGSYKFQELASAIIYFSETVSRGIEPCFDLFFVTDAYVSAQSFARSPRGRGSRCVSPRSTFTFVSSRASRFGNSFYASAHRSDSFYSRGNRGCGPDLRLTYVNVCVQIMNFGKCESKNREPRDSNLTAKI